MQRLLPAWVGLAALASLAAGRAFALDPPHAPTNLCSACHIAHSAPGGNLTTVAGQDNLCLSCHQPGGVAASQSFVDSDQARPWPGLPVGEEATGTSHRWDANAAGHVVFLGGAPTPSTGTLVPVGRFTGAYSKTYTITITRAGPVGAATFNWVATTPGGGAGTNRLTGALVPLDQGVSVSFLDGTAPSFQVGDQWHLYARAGLREPTNAVLLAHLNNGVGHCAACHDEHSQEQTPFDPTAPAYGGPGSGQGRHFMRLDNDRHQLCLECHASFAVTNATAGSHPVGISVPADATHQRPVRLPLEGTTTNLGCLTCHTLHHSLVSDGRLLRLTNSVAVCVECHRQSDTLTPAAHLAATNSATLWPGGRLGSLMPARTLAEDRGSCLNCHAVHGWPDAANPTTHYPSLLADFEENLCHTCHGTNGPAVKQVQADFRKTRHHPVANAEQRPGRKVECTDCHNPHLARSGGHIYSATATATRNRVSNPLLRVSGVDFNYSSLTNFQPVPANLYTVIPSAPGATKEYQICLKCHSSYAWGAGPPPTGLSSNGPAVTPVQTDLAQEFSPMNRSGHPIVTGLDNYPNSIAVGGRKGLQAAAMKAPWNVNLGQQTMTCTDCHNTDAAAPAAQGPHGSAAQFILRGPNANNWPNVTLNNFNTSWCANCHNDSAGTGHSRSEHRSQPCYVCHIVIPHGGKVSRLMADNNSSMPARYAYGNNVTTVGMQQFTKAATNSYSENGHCRTSCGHHGGGTGNEEW